MFGRDTHLRKGGDRQRQTLARIQAIVACVPIARKFVHIAVWFSGAPAFRFSSSLALFRWAASSDSQDVTTGQMFAFVDGHSMSQARFTEKR